MKYIVKVGETESLVEIEGDTVTVDGISVTARLDRRVDTPEYLLEFDQARHRFAAERWSDPDRWSIVFQGGLHEVEVQDERTHHIRSLAAPAAGGLGTATVKAPMPGLFVKRLVEVGEVVAAGQGLVVLEAMKMENELRSPIAARVLAIHGESGQAIEKGRPLVELGPVEG